MRAWVLHDYGRLVLEEAPTPQGEGVLVRVVAVGVCGSDLSVYKGSAAMRARWHPPLVLGHEVAGVVEEGPPHLLGRAVALHPAIPCGTCGQCQAGRPHLCPRRIHLGFHLSGGLAERVRIPEAQAYPLPPGLPAWKGALAEPLAVALHGVNRGLESLPRRPWSWAEGASGPLRPGRWRRGAPGSRWRRRTRSVPEPSRPWGSPSGWKPTPGGFRWRPSPWWWTRWGRRPP